MAGSHPCSIPNSLLESWRKESDPGSRLELIESLCPPEPQLLDTCVLQNLDWVDRQQSEGSDHWDGSAFSDPSERYGAELAKDLRSLAALYCEFEYRSGYPWLVCDAAIAEANLLAGPIGGRLRDFIEFIAGHQKEWSVDAYPGTASGALLAAGHVRYSPLILRALGVRSSEEVWAASGPLKYLPDIGDRLVAAQAILANIPAVLTTDSKSFWNYRTELAHLGLQVMRPVELLEQYGPYWQAVDTEMVRRRAGQ